LRILGTCLALALTIIPPAIWHYESRIQGFNSGWPDAISCKAQLPELNGQSLYIFYYNGLSVGRRYFGSVVRYFLVGGFNDTKGYGPHEVWFLADQNKSLLRVQENLDVIKWMDEKGKEQKLGKSDLDPITQRYVETFLAFPGLDCGGDTINQVIVSGNAFSFARKL
jgi:hypothetical protein